MSRTSSRVAAAALACVPCAVLAQVAPPPPPVQQPDEIIVTGTALTLTAGIAGQTVTTIDTRDIALTPATTIGDIVKRRVHEYEAEQEALRDYIKTA